MIIIMMSRTNNNLSKEQEVYRLLSSVIFIAIIKFVGAALLNLTVISWKTLHLVSLQGEPHRLESED